MSLTTPSGGIEELVDETSGKEIVLTPPLVDRFADLTKKYEQSLGLGAREVWARNYVHDVLLPSNINLFLQQTREYEHHPKYQIHTGYFISQLIQNSYNAENNDFELDMNSLKVMNNVVSNVSGTKERMVRVVITGEIGDECGYQVQHSTLTIEKVGRGFGQNAQSSIFTIGEAGDRCGAWAKHSTFTIGKAGGDCGHFATRSTFTIEEAGYICGQGAHRSTFTIGEAGYRCGYLAEHSTFIIEKAGDLCGREAKNSTFKTHNPLQYEQFKEFAPQDTGNTIYLLSRNGSMLKGGEW